MDLKVGMEITAETIFEKVVTGNVTSILEKSVVIENEDGRHVIKRDTLKNMGYLVDAASRPDRKRVHIHIKKKGE